VTHHHIFNFIIYLFHAISTFRQVNMCALEINLQQTNLQGREKTETKTKNA